MSDGQSGATDLEAAGWRLDLAADGDELHLEHEETGSTYVLDDQGNLTVPGGTASGDVEELQSTLAAAIENGHDTADSDDLADVQEERCSVECDQETGVLSLSAAERIELDAGEIELTGQAAVTVSSPTRVALEGKGQVDVSSDGQLNLTSSGLGTLDASGPLQISGAIVQIN